MQRRDQAAMFNASRTNAVRIVDETRHPTMRRAYTSVMNATYTKPDQDATYVKSATQSSFGRDATNRRFTRSGAREWFGSDLVVRT